MSLMLCVCCLFLALVTPICRGSGYFEININTVRNLRGELSNGSCCDGERSAGSGRCPDPCDTYVKVCLKEYQSRAMLNPRCTFGNLSSQVIGADSFNYNTGDPRARLVLPFDFAWTVSGLYLYIFVV